jgi:hypothetical protein
LEDFARFRCNFVDTEMVKLAKEQREQAWIHVLDRIDVPLNADNEDEFRLCRDIEGAFSLAQAGEPDLFTLCIPVFLDVGLRALEDYTSLFFLGL